MQATVGPVRVGDVVIYVPGHSARPIKTNVAKVTPKGWLRIDMPSGATSRASALFRPCRYGTGYETEGKMSDGKVYVYTDETWAKLNAEAAELEEHKVKCAAEQAKREAERDARLAAETAEVKGVLDSVGGIRACVRHNETLPDGSRMFWLSLPVQPEHAERKGNFEIAIVRLRDIQDYDWPTRGQRSGVEIALTYANASGSSFVSCGGTHHDNDEVALLAAARYLYNSW